MGVGSKPSDCLIFSEETFHAALNFQALTARIARVTDVFFLVELFAREADLFGVDDDDAVATINMGRKGRCVFAPEHVGYAGKKAACRLSCRIHHIPFVLYFLFFG